MELHFPNDYSRRCSNFSRSSYLNLLFRIPVLQGPVTNANEVKDGTSEFNDAPSSK